MAEDILRIFNSVSLDLSRLEKPRLRSGKVIARCPACAEAGADRAGEHLSIEDEGRGAYRCIVDPNGAGGPHSKRIWELAGIRSNGKSGQLWPAPKAQIALAKGIPRIPPLRPLSVGEMAAIANLRGWCSFAGLELLTRRALLWYGDVYDNDQTWPSWVITDSAHRNAQARRLDGVPWSVGGGAKAKTLPRSDPSWPIGAPEIGKRQVVLLCEGGPDFLASLLVGWWNEFGPDLIAPVCLTGANNVIHPEALPFFDGKRVRIAVHADTAGRAAGRRWAEQLYRAGAALVDAFDFTGLLQPTGRPVKDLADFATTLADGATTTIFDLM